MIPPGSTVTVGEMPEPDPNDPKRDEIDPRLVDPFGVMRQSSIMPGINGMPFRGKQIPNLKESDPGHKQPVEGMSAKVEILELNKPADLERYKNIVQIVANGFAQIGVEDRVYDEDIKSWRVFIRYYELFTHMPDSPGNG